MANLKVDLLNELRNKKYYSELELIRLAGDPAMTYREKIKLMVDELETLSSMNNNIALVEGYFPDEQPQQQPIVEPQSELPEAPPQKPPHAGQTHSE